MPGCFLEVTKTRVSCHSNFCKIGCMSFLFLWKIYKICHVFNRSVKDDTDAAVYSSSSFPRCAAARISFSVNLVFSENICSLETVKNNCFDYIIS